nr:hypothetical protein [Tanacetum cinerariifolium]
RVAHQHDHPDVRHALVTDALENLVGRHAVLDQRAVSVSTQGVQPGQDAGNLMLDFFVADDAPGNRAKALFKPVGDDQNAVAART